MPSSPSERSLRGRRLPAMANKADNRRVGRRWWPAITVSLLLIYVASIGPMSRVDVPIGWRTLYRPVLAIATFPQVGRPLVGYLNLWIPTGSREAYVYDPDDGGIWYQCGFALDATPGTSR
jgi:hypothetical protein